MADMSATEINAAPNGVENAEMQGSGCGLLVVVGEPFTEPHKELILEEITKGFKSWDDAAHGCDINAELAAVAAAAASGEESPNGERIITHSADNLQTEVLIYPTAQTLTGRIRSLLSASLRHKHIIYAGHAIHGTGAWILQDDIFNFSNLVQACRSPDVEPGLTQNDCTLSIHCPGEGDWSTTALTKECKNIKAAINPDDHLPELAGVIQFTAYLSSFIKCHDVGDLLQSSDVVGNIRFSKPTLYIFPGGEGDSSLFGISGFNLLINGGYSRKACFWDFTRHLDRIDAVLLTHLSSDNIFGISSVLQRKSSENVHPEVGYVYYNAVENGKTNGDDKGLLVNVLNEANKIVDNMKNIGHSPTPCTRTNSPAIAPINLYHKVGHGSLDMYILNPVQDTKELKDFLTQWSKNVRSFSTVKMPQQLPLPEVLSVCALLVWKPAAADENITRIFFPGNAPQQKIFEGLDRLKTLDFLKHPSCCDNDLHAKVRKSSSASKSASKAAVAKVKPAAAPAAEKKAPSKSPSPPKAATPVKETAKKPAPPKSTATGEKKKPKGSISSASSEPKSSPSITPSDTPASSIPETKDPAKEPPAPEPLIPDVVAAEPKKEEPAPPAEPIVPPQNLMDISPQGEPAPITPKEESQPLLPDLAPVAPEPVKAEPAPLSPEPVKAAPLSPEPVQAAPLSPEPVQAAPLSPEPVQAAPLSPEPVEAAPLSPEPAQEPELISMVPETAPESPKDVPQPEAAWEEPPKPAPVEEAKPVDLIEAEVAQSDESAPAVSDEPAKESVPEPAVEPVIPEALPDPARIDFGSFEPEPVEILHGAPKQEQELEKHEFEASEVTKEKASLEEMGIYDGMDGHDPQENIEDVDIDDNQAAPESPEYPFMTPQQSVAKDSFDVPEPMPSHEHLTEVPESAPVEPQRPEELPMRQEESMPAADAIADLSPEQHQDVQNANFSPEELVAADKNAMEEMGIYDDDDEANGNTDQVDAKPDLLQAAEGEEDEGARSRESSVPSSVPSDSLSRETPDTEIEMTGESEEREGSPERREPFVEDEPTVVGPTPTEPEAASAPDLIQGESGNAAFEGEDDLLGDVSATPQQPNLLDDPQENLMEQPAIDSDPTCNTTQPSSQPLYDNYGAPSDPFTDNSPENDQHTPESDLMTPHSDVPSPSSNPFNDNAQSDSTSPDASNPFFGIESSEPFQHPVEPLPCNPFEGMPEAPADGTADGQQGMAPFDPLQGWGEPMGLPSPPPPEEGGATNAVNSVPNDKAADPKTATKKPAAKKPDAAKSRAADAKKTGDKKSPVSPTKPLKRGSPAPAAAKPTANGKATRDAKETKEVTKRPASASATATKKTRPVSAPAPKAEAPAKKAPASKPASAKSRASSASAPAAKAKPLTPVVPVYVDLTYVPHHGNGAYCDMDFFRRVRARYYVISSINPPASVFTALLDAKQTWEDGSLEVTIIPTYDNDTLRHWMGLHRDQLMDLKIDVAPSASRCTIQLQDHETSCAAYRLEF
ncbi:microtubule-associated protein futsch-like [Lineus longissimus]|uniref:microtubule-associated protein futsch-like n=1 Tax=Lineus longissimus TaxID=88925 RepID=UPI00315D25E0